MDALVTKTYLESLTTRELTRLADSRGLDIPPDLDRPFIIEEILEQEEDEDDLEIQELPIKTGGIIFPAALPRQYNITFIEAIVRDPAWAFVFWEINSRDKLFYENSPDFEGYSLILQPAVQQESGTQKKTAPLFSVPVGVDDVSWYLSIPPEDLWYKVNICAVRGGGATILSTSQAFRSVQRLPERGASGDALLQLSGIDELPVLRTEEHSSRAFK
jgi:hypothetical protein